jgi:hypothetical protein
LGRNVIRLHTVGTRYGPQSPQHLDADKPDAPKIITAIPYTVDAMPATSSYDRKSETLRIGTGQIAPVSPAVWDYRVGRMRVVDKWIGYRLKKPRGRKATTDLDQIKADNWTAAFNDDLLRLLRVLACLIKLEASQEVLLRDAISGPLISTDQLRRAGVLPVPEIIRKPLQHANPDDQLGI